MEDKDDPRKGPTTTLADLTEGSEANVDWQSCLTVGWYGQDISATSVS